MGFEWVGGKPEQVFPQGYEQFTARLRVALHKLAQFYAPQIEAWMKTNAPWTDRTGNARQGLHTAVEQLMFETVIWLDHGVEYGKYLEYAHAGNYAIIAPALDHWMPIIRRGVAKLLEAPRR